MIMLTVRSERERRCWIQSRKSPMTCQEASGGEMERESR